MDNAAESNPRTLRTLVIVAAAVFVAALDHTVVVTVLPELMLDLKVQPTELDRATWIVTAYLLGFTVAIPVTARIADVHGHARVMGIALLVFAAGSVAAALAPSLQAMIAARTVQAIGGGAALPVGLAIALHSAPKRRHALIVGAIGACSEAGMALGPLYGGAITTWLGWRWVCWFDVPQALIIAAALLRRAPTPRDTHGLDVRGAVLLAAGTLALTFAASQRSLFDGFGAPLADSELGLSRWTPYALAAAGVVLLGAFGVSQRRTASPLIPAAFWSSAPAIGAIALKGLLGAALIIAMVTVPLYANITLERTPLAAGLLLLWMTVALPPGAIIGGALSRLVGPGAVAAVGLAAGAVGLASMSGWTTEPDPSQTLHLVVAGLGFGMVIAPVYLSAMGAADVQHQATAASFATMARMFGMTVGVAALAAWGVGAFESATAGITLPTPVEGESDALYWARLENYEIEVVEASLQLFTDFFRIASWLLAVAIAPALLMGLRRGVR